MIERPEGHLVSLLANGVNAQGRVEEWVVHCYDCGLEIGPSDNREWLDRKRRQHLERTAGYASS